MGMICKCVKMKVEVMKMASFFAAGMMFFSLAAATPAVTSVTAQQRYPRNGNVDVVVTFSGASNDVAQLECVFLATNSATKAALPVVHITPEKDIAGSGTIWTRRFVWDATADVGEVEIADVALSVGAEMPFGGVQLWENGPYWAECNVGATKPEGTGYFFWWGDTEGYQRNASDTGWESVESGASFSFDARCRTWNKSTSWLQSNGYIDSTGNLAAEHDAATAHLGAPWRMPTSDEIQALVDNCTTTWTTRNGVNGRLVTGKGAYASKSIFLPAAGLGRDSDYGGRECGWYWSSTPDTINFARYLDFGSRDFYQTQYFRYHGQSVRPLRGFSMAVEATTHLALDTRMTPTLLADGGTRDFTDETIWEKGRLPAAGEDIIVKTTAETTVWITNSFSFGKIDVVGGKQVTFKLTDGVELTITHAVSTDCRVNLAGPTAKVMSPAANNWNNVRSAIFPDWVRYSDKEGVRTFALRTGADPSETVNVGADSPEEAMALVPIQIWDKAAAAAGQENVIKKVVTGMGAYAGTWSVAFVLDETKMPEGRKIADTLAAFATGENGLTSLVGATETKTVTIPAAQATSGLYYSLLVSSDLGFTAPTETPHVLADGANDLHFDIDPAEDPSAPRFFKVKASFK